MRPKCKRVVKIISPGPKRLRVKTASPIKAGDGPEIILTPRDIPYLHYLKLTLKGISKGECL